LIAIDLFQTMIVLIQLIELNSPDKAFMNEYYEEFLIFNYQIDELTTK